MTFRLPKEPSVTTYVQTTPGTVQWKSIHDISVKKGFVMAPFDTRNGKKYIMIKPDIIFNDTPGKEVVDRIRSLPSNPQPDWEIASPVVTSKNDFVQQVKTIKKQISTGYFQKSVLSRIKLVKGNYIDHARNIFDDTCRRHPNAFVYLFKSDHHFWLGASPEPLLRLQDGIASTVSLAGTRTHSPDNMKLGNWTMKEVLEQEYVTRYIHDILREFNIRDYRVTSPYVKKAGDLVHLRTDFSFRYAQVKDRIWELLDSLHPTPAVAGQPKDEAISFIKQLEPHDREYYAGFLGPMISDDVVDLFVNLRCMKITPESLSLFIGGGITLESIPEDEWEETQWKAKSLLNIIDQYSTKTDDKAAVQTTHR
ncbi:MAG: chorismate-binding protein [Bacteroidales bacterium]|nr:chorismate-binding protein [Bacteroidales bacterium]MDT8432041.1 chorismate-binding protein [Bacteroidales bacterium]